MEGMFEMTANPIVVDFFSDEQREKVKSLNFSEIAKVLSQSQATMSSPNRGIGKKCYVQITSEKEDTPVVEFFSEASVFSRPQNPETGYRASEVDLFHGVTIHFPIGHGDPKQTCGTVIPFEQFLNEYISDGTTRIIMERVMDSMIQNSEVSDGFLDQVNEVWNGSGPSSNIIFNVDVN